MRKGSPTSLPLGISSTSLSPPPPQTRSQLTCSNAIEQAKHSDLVFCCLLGRGDKWEEVPRDVGCKKGYRLKTARCVLGEMAKKTEPNSLPTQYGQRNQGL